MEPKAKKTAEFTGLKPTGKLPATTAAQSEFNSASHRRPFTVFLLIDNDSSRKTLSDFLRSQSIDVQEYMTAMEFYRDYREKKPGVLITDVRLRGLSGPELHEKLVADNIELPFAFIAGHAESPVAIEGLRKGAFEFLLKPITVDKLLATVARAYAVHYNVDWEFVAEDIDDITKGISRITGRERETLDLIVEGNSSRAISERLGVSIKTVEAHRASINDKMRADDLPHLIRMLMAYNETR